MAASSCKPKKMNIMATAMAVIMDLVISGRTAWRSRPSVRPMKMGRAPTALTATKSGTKHSQNSLMGSGLREAAASAAGMTITRGGPEA